MKTMTAKALLATGLAWAMSPPAAAQKHVALVLDNGGVQQTAPATRIAEGLERMRYQVIVGRQQDQSGMRKYINEFRGALTDAEVALFYFKGVTLDASGRNLLVATNAAPGRPIEQSTVALDEIADLMTASRANVLLVDAGYANRTAEELARSGTGITPTIARIRDRSRFMVAFANMPGRAARSDSESPFAEMLAKYLSDGSLTSADLGRRLRSDVYEHTRGSQLPWVRSDLGAVRLAALPESTAPVPLDTPAAPAIDRVAFVRAMQTELQRHQCYSGTINGSAALTHSALQVLGRTRAGQGGPHIVVASAHADEYESWLEWIRSVQDPICAPAHVVAPIRRAYPAKPPRARAVVKHHREYRGPRRGRAGRGDDVRHTGVLGRGKGDYYAPSNPFNSPK